MEQNAITDYIRVQTQVAEERHKANKAHVIAYEKDQNRVSEKIERLDTKMLDLASRHKLSIAATGIIIAGVSYLAYTKMDTLKKVKEPVPVIGKRGNIIKKDIAIDAINKNKLCVRTNKGYLCDEKRKTNYLAIIICIFFILIILLAFIFYRRREKEDG